MLALMSAPGVRRAPIAYGIWVRGEVADTLVADLSPSRVEVERGRTLIVVEIVDQSHLHGVLERLRDLNIEIESVNPQ
jgi:hypothetical protein